MGYFKRLQAPPPNHRLHLTVPRGLLHFQAAAIRQWIPKNRQSGFSTIDYTSGNGVAVNNRDGRAVCRGLSGRAGAAGEPERWSPEREENGGHERPVLD